MRLKYYTPDGRCLFLKDTIKLTTHLVDNGAITKINWHAVERPGMIFTIKAFKKQKFALHKSDYEHWTLTCVETGLALVSKDDIQKHNLKAPWEVLAFGIKKLKQGKDVYWNEVKKIRKKGKEGYAKEKIKKGTKGPTLATGNGVRNGNKSGGFGI